MQHTDAKRAQKLRGLLTRLKQGKNVQNRDLQTWLGADGYKRYEDAWAAQKVLREQLADKPAQIVRYEVLLKKANFTHNKAQGYDRTGRFRAAELEYRQADQEFELVLRYLEQIVAADPNLRVWFDRDPGCKIDRSNGIDPVSVPQVVTSKSHHNQARNGGLQVAKMKKLAVKIDVIEQELVLIDGEDKAEKLRAKREAGIRKVHPERGSD